MAEFKVRTRGDSNPQGKPRVYFTCHPKDFDKCFDRICGDVFRTHDCAIYYTADMTEPLDETNVNVDLGRMNLFLVPVTFKLMNEDNRAMAVDISYAKEKNIPILPFMMESGIDAVYSLPKNFGERQYLSPYSTDTTEIGYGEKLKNYLEAVLISDEMANRVRAAFDAYVFLSYRKKDRRYANELMRIIHNIPGCCDIAIWYDEFLTPGESFMKNIEKAMKQSELFALLVTPNLLEEGNFVMRVEYPAARNAGMDILPAEMEETDRNELQSKFNGICDPIKTEDQYFAESLLGAIKKIAISENDSNSEHNFLIGLAYLDGIDVEVNTERGTDLITQAADAGLPEAMEKLYNMYFNGDKVKLNYREALKWAERLVDLYTREYGEEHTAALAAMEMVSIADRELGDYRRALEIESKRYRISSKVLGENHDITTDCMHSMALIYIELGEYKKANEIEQRSFRLKFAYAQDDMKKDSLDIETRRRLSTFVATLAKIYGKLDDPKLATLLIQNQYEILRENLGEEHIETVTAKKEYALALMEERNYEKALEALSSVYELQCKLLVENHPHTLDTLNNIAGAYCMLGNTDEAERIYQTVYELRCAVLGEDHPLVKETLDSLKHLKPEEMDVEEEIDLSTAEGEARFLLRQLEKTYQFLSPIMEGYDEEYLKKLTEMADIYKKRNCPEAEKMFRDRIKELTR